jgi:hypothetical protein
MSGNLQLVLDLEKRENNDVFVLVQQYVERRIRVLIGHVQNLLTDSQKNHKSTSTGTVHRTAMA